MREMGGYIEFEHFNNGMLHENGIKLNSARNCLAYLIKKKNIRSIVLPYFLCDSVYTTCCRYNVRVKKYHIDDNFLPCNLQLAEDDWVYIVNYYGQLTDDQLHDLKKAYKHIVIDNVQAYFEAPLDGVDTLYSCRKFFGVADGGILFSDIDIEENISYAESYEHMEFLLGRFERTANEFYNGYIENNQRHENTPILRMSKLTENILHGVDYGQIRHQRTENFGYLWDRLSKHNLLKVRKIEGGFAYPLCINSGAVLRKKMIENKIYIPILWPNVLHEVKEDCFERFLAENILPLPCDQRYSIKDMEWMCTVIENNI